MNSPNNIQEKILQLANILSKFGAGEWVNTRKVAKLMEGSEVLSDVICAYAQLPEAKSYFAVLHNGSKILLTEAGARLVSRKSGGTDQRTQQESQMQQVARAVKSYASRLKRQYLKVLSVSTVSRSSGRYIQAVQVAIEDEIVPTETPVDLHRRLAHMVHGRVVGQEPDGGVLYVAFDSEVLEDDLPATLAIDRAFLLHGLADSLERLDAVPRLADPLLKSSGRAITIARRESGEVASVLGALPAPWTRFLWGPPGAGKTYAIGHLIITLLTKEPTSQILLVAPSNLAVDVAVEQILAQPDKEFLSRLLIERQILRYGYPRKRNILEQAELQGPTEQNALTSEIKRISNNIAHAERARESEMALSVLRSELLSKQEELRRVVEAHIKECRVVATTTAMAYLPSSPISKMTWDTVLVDEVTMIPPATCLFLSSLAERRFLLAGDPRQLGPIYQEESNSDRQDFDWMGRDVFDLAGLSHGEGEKRQIVTTDARLSRITSQRRCTGQIWKQVAHLYPSVESLVNESLANRLQNLPPHSGQGLVVLDVGESHNEAHCEKLHSSWRNEFTADLAMEVASAIIAESSLPIPSIAIITPYRAQVRLLAQRIREEQRSGSPLGSSSTAGTIHQFQGSEADIVIFDLVDGEGRAKLGKLMRGDAGFRLATVAVTRARGKCIVIANRAWCQTHMERADNPLIWDMVVGSKPEVRMAVLPPHTDPKSKKRPGLVESPIEAMLLEALVEHPELRARDVQVQYSIYDEGSRIVSRADFAFPEAKYAVYCDGAQWHLQRNRWQRDLRQRNKLTELGWIFSVFSGSEIYRDAKACAKQVWDTYKTRIKQ